MSTERGRAQKRCLCDSRISRRGGHGSRSILSGLLGFPSIRNIIVITPAFSCLRFAFQIADLLFFAIISSDIILAKMFLEPAIFEAHKILVIDGPERPSNGAVTRNFAEAHSRAQDMADTVHPCCFTAFVVRIHDCNPIIDLLQCEAVLGGR